MGLRHTRDPFAKRCFKLVHICCDGVVARSNRDRRELLVCAVGGGCMSRPYSETASSVLFVKMSNDSVHILTILLRTVVFVSWLRSTELVEGTECG